MPCLLFCRHTLCLGEHFRIAGEECALRCRQEDGEGCRVYTAPPGQCPAVTWTACPVGLLEGQSPVGASFRRSVLTDGSAH